jgi:hypothetical protein
MIIYCCDIEIKDIFEYSLQYNINSYLLGEYICNIPVSRQDVFVKLFNLDTKEEENYSSIGLSLILFTIIFTILRKLSQDTQYFILIIIILNLFGLNKFLNYIEKEFIKFCKNNFSEKIYKFMNFFYTKEKLLYKKNYLIYFIANLFLFIIINNICIILGFKTKNN